MRVIILSLALFTVSGYCTQAQLCSSTRYEQRVFTNISKTADVVFGNAPSVTSPYLGEDVTIDIDLTMDIFEPTGDTLALRPLVILAFGGGFLIGSKDDEDIQATCDSLAHKGYVTASINYRLGMNVSDAGSAERAVYRGMQDYSAAIRYLKEFASTYRIDTNYIFVGGVSAGSISALHLIFAEEAERPASTFASGGINPAPDLGCRDCSGNNYDHSSTNVMATINCWGAMGDVNWIEPGENVPIISFHGDQDAIVPIDSGYPFTLMASMPYVYGSIPISNRADSIGLYNELYIFAGEGHNVWGSVVNNSFVGGPTQYFEPIVQSISDFLYLFMKPNTSAISGDIIACLDDIITYSVTNTAGSEYCWDITGGTIVSSDPRANTIDVQWNGTGQHTVSVVEISRFVAEGDTQIINVTVNELPPEPILQEVNDSLFTDTGYGYQWYFDGTVVPGENSYFITSLQNGAYTVVISDSNGCENTSVAYNYVNAGLEDAEYINSNSIVLYPNPNNGFFGIKINNSNTKISNYDVIVYNVIGEIIYKQHFNGSEYPGNTLLVNIAQPPEGMYFLSVSTASVFRCKKFVISVCR